MIPTRLNKKRFTRKETEQLIANGAELDEALSEIFSWSGYIKVDIYHLPDKTILYVDHGFGKEGKSDVYAINVFNEWTLATKACKRYHELKTGSSYDWFIFFSSYKKDLINHLDNSTQELLDFLNVQYSQLDFSLESLDLLSKRIRMIGIENNEYKLVDGLVAYSGEIIKRTVGGEWKNLKHSGIPAIYSEISNFENWNWYSPVNRIWEAFYDPANFPLRKGIRNEIAKFKRNNSLIKALTK